MPTPKTPLSFTKRLVATSVIVLLFLSLPIAFASYWILRQNTLEQAGNATRTLSELTAKSVDRILHDHLRNLVYTANLEETRGLGERSERYASMIELLGRHNPGYLWIGVAKPDGTVLASNDNLLQGRDVSSRPWFKTGLERAAVMDLHEAKLLAALLPARDGEKYQFVDFTTPLRDDNGQVRAVVGIHLDWKALIAQLESELFARADLKKITAILAADGSLRLGNKIEMATVQESTDWANMEGFKTAKNGKSSWSIQLLPDGKQYLVGFSPANYSPEMARLGWIAVTMQDVGELSSPITKAMLTMLAVLFLGTASTLLIVHRTGKRISLNAMAHIEALEKGQPLEIEASKAALPSELLPLSGAVQKLITDLHLQRDNLQASLEKSRENYWLVESLIDQAPVPLAMLDLNMNYVSTSAQWKTLFAPDIQGSLIGLNHHECVGVVGDFWRSVYDSALLGRSSQGHSEAWITKSGEILYLDWAAAPWTKPDQTQGGILLMCKDVTEDFKLRYKLAASEERFKLAMEGTNEGLWDWKIESDEVYFSPGYKRMLGYEDHELENKLETWRNHVHPEDLERNEASLAAAINNEAQSLFVGEFRMKHREGRWVYIISKAKILRDDQGKAIRLVGTHVDRTEQILLEGRLREASIAAEAEREANLEKSRFLATISHEIRTPLNGVIGYAKLLHMDLPDGEQKEEAGYLMQTSESLSILLNDILDFSKLESGMFKLHNDPFLIDQLLNTSIELHRITAQAKGIELKLVDTIRDHRVYAGDIGRLRQILQNLLSNAIKFTSVGSVELHLSSSPSDDETDLITFSVTDTGRGIPKDKLDMLFKPYSQVHQDHENRLGGTGLGLAIIKSLATAMGGKADVTSELGKGSRFSVCIPMKRERAVQGVNSVRIQPKQALSILVADDHPLNLKLMSTFLQRDGHQVTSANDGLAALDLALTVPFDFILLDVDMPKLSGYEVARTVRESQGPNQYCEIAAQTGHVFGSDIDEAQKAGINYHFSKPIQFDVLLNRIAMTANEKYIHSNSAISDSVSHRV